MTVNHNRPIHHHGFIIFIFIFSLMFLPAFSDSPGGSDPNTDNDSYLGQQQKFSPSMGIIIIVLIAALFFMGFFSIYIRHCTGATTSSGGASRRGVIGSVARSMRGPRGLDPAVVESLPTFTYSAVKELKIGKGALECAVCLLEFEDDDTLRLIPKCDHVFHPDCIDQWLVGHTTCPVCRSNLADTTASTHAPPDFAIQNDAVVEECDNNNNTRRTGNDDEEEINSDEREDSMEEPMMMSRNRTIRRSGSIGRPRWLGRLNFTRSFSTGHVAVKQWEKFTLRLPEDVRKQIMSGQLERTTSAVVLPRETSSRRGYRAGFGSVRVDRGGFRSDRWAFTLAPPFFTRAPSIRSPKVAAAAAVGSRQGSVRLPV